MNKIVLLKERNKRNAFESKMWMEALEFWRIPFEMVDTDTFCLMEANQIDLLFAAGLDEIDQMCLNHIEKYLSNGGKVCISGNLPSALGRYFGGIRTTPVRRKDSHRCIRITKQGGFAAWQRDEILFFSNTFHADGLDYFIEDLHHMDADVVAESEEMSLIDPDTEQWRDWRKSSSPAMIEKKVSRGKIMYIPIPIGAMEWVVQPRVPTFTEFPYQLRNNALLLFMRHVMEYLIGKETFQYRKLWPNDAKCVVALSGDVHDHEGIPGRADREYKDMLDNMDILKEYGLEGRATFYISGKVVKKHPKAILEGFQRGYELCSHTWQDTCYSSQGFDYAQQKNDIVQCSDEFQKAAPQYSTYLKGFRTHGYNSNFDTRTALEVLGYDYIADLQGWEFGGKYNDQVPEQLTTYCSYPQQAKDYRGRRLNLLEIPDTVANDHFVYRIKQMTPEQALDFYKEQFDKIYRLGGIFQTCLHPYVSLREDPLREKTYRELIQYIKTHDDVAFMRMDELAYWWKENFSHDGGNADETAKNRSC